MEKTEPRRYYDFSHLLLTKCITTQEERKAALRGLTDKEAKEMVYRCLISALIQNGDALYEKTKKEIYLLKDTHVKEVIKALDAWKILSELAAQVNTYVKRRPEIGALYSQFLEFEIALVRDKNKRLTPSK